MAKGASPLKQSPAKNAKKNEAFLRTKPFAKTVNTKKIIDNASSIKPTQSSNSLLTANSGKNSKSPVTVYNNQTIGRQSKGTISSGNDTGRTPRIIE